MPLLSVTIDNDALLTLVLVLAALALAIFIVRSLR